MLTQESPRFAGASVNSGGDRNTPNSSQKRPIPLSDAADRFLNQLAIDLRLGITEMWQLPPSLAQLVWFFYYDGYDSRQGEIDKLNFECDRLYGLAFNKLPLPSQNSITFEELEERRATIYGGATN